MDRSTFRSEGLRAAKLTAPGVSIKYLGRIEPLRLRGVAGGAPQSRLHAVACPLLAWPRAETLIRQFRLKLFGALCASTDMCGILRQKPVPAFRRTKLPTTARKARATVDAPRGLASRPSEAALPTELVAGDRRYTAALARAVVAHHLAVSHQTLPTALVVRPGAGGEAPRRVAYSSSASR